MIEKKVDVTRFAELKPLPKRRTKTNPKKTNKSAPAEAPMRPWKASGAIAQPWIRPQPRADSSSSSPSPPSKSKSISSVVEREKRGEERRRRGRAKQFDTIDKENVEIAGPEEGT
jgi:hypothetical protein